METKDSKLEKSTLASRVPLPSQQALVMPNTIHKSSKDPNRGLYPRSRKSSRSQSSSSSSTSQPSSSFTGSTSSYSKACDLPLFCKASDMLVSQRLNMGLNVDEGNHSKSHDHISQEVTTKSSYAMESNESLTDPDFKAGPSYRITRSRKRKERDREQNNTLDGYINVTHRKRSKLWSPEDNLLKKKIWSEEHTKAINMMLKDVSCDKEKIMHYKASNLNQFVPSEENKSSCSVSSSQETVVKNRQDLEDDKWPDFYGLFGGSPFPEEDEEDKEVKINHFEKLPEHVMEQIFCQVPFSDLLSLQLVCSSWNDIISNHSFLRWKKAYYRYKKAQTVNSVVGLCESLTGSNAGSCFSVLLEYMQNDFTRKQTAGMLEFLKKHQRFLDAEEVVMQRFPEMVEKGVNAWTLVAAAVLLSETVSDVVSIFDLLMYPTCHVSLPEVVNAMYCITTLLLYCKNTFRINHGLHYRMYYTIYLMENSLPIDYNSSLQGVKPQTIAKGQQSLHSYCDTEQPKTTYEQMRILNHRLQPKQVVKVIAFAGTGKTSTLIQYSRLYPQLKFLNVMFNKSVCIHAAKCFPSNVICKTSHSLAYQAIGHKYRSKLAIKLKPYEVMPFLSKPANIGLHAYSYAKHVLRTIETFCSSADEHITLAHVPRVTADIAHPELQDFERLAICSESEALWSKMVSLSANSCRITHDVYLKLYHLSHPVFENFDCIMIDEAQDSNGAMLGIMLTQNVPVILVGDPHQQIYAFRGAENALQNVPATHVYHLTKSFRFGPEIAYVANSCLEVLKRTSSDTLVGSMKESSVAGEAVGQYAIITRTNLTLLKEAVTLCCTNTRKRNQPHAIYGAFAGGLASYGFDQIVDIWRLKSNEGKSTGLQVIRDKFIRRFQTVKDLHTYAKRAEDSDLQGKIEFVFQHGEKIVDYVDTIKKKCNHPLELANVVFCTAHKSKGLEFSTVHLTDDYHIAGVPCVRVAPNSPNSDEFNILYVALTRAKRCLIMSEKLSNVLLAAQEKFEFPIPRRKLLKPGVTEVTCASCAKVFAPHIACVLTGRKMILSNDVEIRGGPLCTKCSTTPKLRPVVHHPPTIMYMDFIDDVAHTSMASLVGPLPTDPPIVHNFGLLPEEQGELIWQINIPRIFVRHRIRM